MVVFNNSDKFHLTIIVVPGTLAKRQPDGNDPNLPTDLDPDEEEPDELEDDPAERTSELIKGVLDDLEELLKDENPEGISWFTEADDIQPQANADAGSYFRSKRAIAHKIASMYSLADAVEFLRLRPNTGGTPYKIRVRCVEWARDKEKAELENKDLVGGGNSESARNYGATRLNKVIAECERKGEPYIIVGHSHGGTVSVRALRRRAALFRPLNKFMGAINVGTPPMTTRLHVFRRTLLDFILSPTYGQLLAAGLVLLAILYARLFGFSAISNSAFSNAAITPLSLPIPFLTDAPTSSYIAGYTLYAMGIYFGSLLVISWGSVLLAKIADNRLKKSAPQLFVNAKHDEVVELFKDLQGEQTDRFIAFLQKAIGQYGSKKKIEILAGLSAYALLRLISRTLIAMALLSATVILCISLGILDQAQGLGGFIADKFTPDNLAQSAALTDVARAYLSDMIFSPEFIGPWIFSLIIALGTMLWELRQSYRQVPALVERIAAMTVLGLREIRVPRQFELNREPTIMELRAEPAEVFAVVSSLARARSAKVLSIIRDRLSHDKDKKQLRSIETLKELNRLPAQEGLVHTSYFRSRFFLLYIAKLIANLSNGMLTVPREKPQPRAHRVNYDETAKIARKYDFARIIKDASETSFVPNIENDRRWKDPDTTSWSA